MRGWGVMLLILGIGSFILPTFGLQFRVLEIFGESQGIAGIGMAVIGGVMVGASFLTGEKAS